MTTPGEAAAQPPVLPDAPIIVDELNCPLCGYDLRGLPSQRCPECGHAFDPDELRAAKIQKRDWLFEHARREKSRSFLKTAFKTLRPFEFWKRIGVASAIVPARLEWWAFVWFVAFNVFTIGCFLGASASAYYELLPNGATAPMWGSPATRPEFSDAMASVLMGRRLVRDLPLVLAILAWPVVTFFAFRFFGLTLRRAGIHRGHLWRCVLYPWPTVATPMAFAITLTMFFELNSPSIWRPDPMSDLVVGIFGRSYFQIAQAIGLTSIATLVITIAVLISTLHLIAAHVRYLRLPQAIAQALLVQAVTWLFILAVIHLSFGA